MVAPMFAAIGLPAVAQPAPPASWIAYAERVQYDLSQWIEQSDDIAAVRLRARLQARYSVDPKGESEIKLWADPTGTVTRVEIVENPAMTTDAQAAIVGRALGEAPPRDLRWPIRIVNRRGILTPYRRPTLTPLQDAIGLS